MEEKRMNYVYEIKSKYVLKNLYNYIKDKYFELKIFAYSKKFQNKFDINYSYLLQKIFR